MPRSGPRRAAVAVKLGDSEREQIDQRALDEGLTIRGGEPNRSEMTRRLLAYAMQHMPTGWKPE